jgi:hypothetical protein
MSIPNAVSLLSTIIQLGNNKDTFDELYVNLLLRRLHMIIDWTNYPERLI